MKRVMRVMIVIAFLVSTFACASDQARPGTSSDEPFNKLPIQVVKIKTTGRIVDVTDTRLTIERSVKGTVEPFELELEKPITKFKVGDKVIVWYISKDEKNVLKEIKKRGPKLIRKNVQPEAKTAPFIPPDEESVPIK
jgi:hypothetical protein